mgnify:CR=1 FL=1
MTNDLTHLSYTLYNNPGVYTLLLGSGVSRSAGIPTGWEIILHQITQLGIIHNEDVGDDPIAWYKGKFKKDPDYSDILESTTSSAEERINLLKRYFEPTEEEFEEGLKRPTKAHQAIAKLVKAGIFKVIVTTNFDRLLENALKDEGIEPVVISNPSQIENVQPIIHNRITIVKINGDYLEARFLNIRSELSSYDERMNTLLKFIFENFGLITTGWSATWDHAIVDLLKSSNKFRYNNCFTFKGGLSPELEELCKFRQGNLLGVSDADTLFTELLENIDALDQFKSDHPLTLELALAKLKKFIVKQEYEIQLHDLVMSFANEAVNKLDQHQFPGTPDENNFVTELEFVFRTLHPLNQLLSTGVFWGKEYHHKLWLKVITKFTNPVSRARSYHMWGQLERIPVLIFLYNTGISSVMAEDFNFLGKLLSMKLRDKDGGKLSPILEDVNPISSLEEKFAQLLFKPTKKHTPTSEMLFGRLKVYLSELLADEFQYNDTFDYFEYILALMYLHHVDESWFPIGRFAWKNRRGLQKDSIVQVKQQEASQKEELFELVNPHLFNDYETLSKLQAKINKDVSEMRFY